MSGKHTSFKPIKIPHYNPNGVTKGPTLTISTNISGEVVEQFEKMAEENNLNRSALMRQMLFHCLGRVKELEHLRRQVLLWGESDE